MERAMKHFIIAAKLGHDMSVNALKEIFKGRLMSKEDLDGVRCAHRAAIDATKSIQSQREEGEATGKESGCIGSGKIETAGGRLLGEAAVFGGL
eukprot:scaffold2929_cov138-Skeletonema_marinoi.AAC.2